MNDSPIQARRAWLLLALFALTASVLVAISLSPWRSGFADAPSRGTSDVFLYRAEVERIAAGQGYYEAAAAELRARGYPTRSVFNWRTPLPVALVAWLPERGAQMLLGLAGIALLVLGFAAMSDDGRPRRTDFNPSQSRTDFNPSLSERSHLWQGLLAALLLTGALLPLVLGDLFLMPEVWSGTLLCLSLAAYGTERRKLGVAAGAAALLLRELAAPYCLLCAALAAWERRWREVAAWGLVFGLYAAFYAVHLAQVLPLIRPDDVAHAQGWVRFGGAAFVISTVQMNVYLLLLPQWLTAIYLAVALVGFSQAHTPWQRRVGLAGAGYVLAFGLVGQDFNQYWGSMIAPIFCFGAAQGAVALMAAARKVLPARVIAEAPSRCRPAAQRAGVPPAQASGLG
jgi:hypothetical protein